jgi:hypothetical protein
MKPFKPVATVTTNIPAEIVGRIQNSEPTPHVPKRVSGMPTSKGPIPYQPDGDPKSVFSALETLIKQQQNLWEKVGQIETLVQTLVLRLNRTSTVVDETHPRTGGNGKRLPNGLTTTAPSKTPLVVDIPNVETLLTAAKAYAATYGKETLAAAVHSFGVKKISELPEEKRPDFLRAITVIEVEE